MSNRPARRTKERRDTILQTLRSGLTRRAAAEYADMDRTTLHRWMVEDAPMRRAVIKAEAEAEVRHVAVVTGSALGRPAQYDAGGRVSTPSWGTRENQVRSRAALRL